MADGGFDSSGSFIGNAARLTMEGSRLSHVLDKAPSDSPFADLMRGSRGPKRR